MLNSPEELNNWNTRRQEIMSLFEQYEYGKTPSITFDAIKHIKNEHLDIVGGYVKETYGLVFFKDKKYCGLQYEMFYKKGLKEKYPAILHLNPFSSNPIGYMRDAKDNNFAEIFPMDYIADAGYVAINCCVDDICADDVDTYKKGIMEFAQPQGPDGWCAISAWAWAISRIIDQLETNPIIDTSKITVCGCSRGGKATLWAGASDKRIAAIFASVSGCCGSAMHRDKTGETIEKITNVFPHWSCERFKNYKNKEWDLPMDQHMLLALIAPRPLYITSASLDDWAHPKKEFESCVRVSELYEAMGKKGLSSYEFPNVNSPIIGGDIQYHLREGEHGCKMYDWQQVIPFLNKELNN
ncbi:MAG: hypothetical protein HUK24_00335 [Sphaerochaetaceae bacterium]|nr:hypothetical protein [Sphaerochaetaceae bacterium]